MENIALAHEYLSRNRGETNRCVMFLDIKGAYDNIHRPTLFRTLEESIYSMNVVKTIESMYVNTRAELFFNNASFGTFKTFKGTQQGAPLSPKLFNYFLDPSVDYFILKEKLLTLDHHAVLILFFADDIAIFCTEFLRDSYIHLLEKFATRAKVTFAPHKCVYLGHSDPPTIQGGLMRKADKAEYLGAFFDLNGLRSDHFKQAIAKSYEITNKIVSTVDISSVSLYHRAIIFKTFVRSKIEYLLALHDLTDLHFQAIRVFYHFSLERILNIPSKSSLLLIFMLLGIEDPTSRLVKLKYNFSLKLSKSSLPWHKALNNPDRDTGRFVLSPEVRYLAERVRQLRLLNPIRRRKDGLGRIATGHDKITVDKVLTEVAWKKLIASGNKVAFWLGIDFFHAWKRISLIRRKSKMWFDGNMLARNREDDLVNFLEGLIGDDPI
jgi:hypothetical protein